MTDIQEVQTAESQNNELVRQQEIAAEWAGRFAAVNLVSTGLIGSANEGMHTQQKLFANLAEGKVSREIDQDRPAFTHIDFFSKHGLPFDAWASTKYSLQGSNYLQPNAAPSLNMQLTGNKDGRLNRNLMAGMAEYDPNRLLSFRIKDHTSDIAVIKSEEDIYKDDTGVYRAKEFQERNDGECDGFVVVGDGLKDMPVMVSGADCPWVLFAGKTAEGEPVYGAVHSGSKGTAQGIVANLGTILFEDLGCKPEEVFVHTGYGTRWEYEIPEAYMQKYSEQGGRKSYPQDFAGFVRPSREGKVMYDLGGNVHDDVVKLGIPAANIEFDGSDSITDETKHSSRRDRFPVNPDGTYDKTHNNGKGDDGEYAGRMMAVIIPRL